MFFKKKTISFRKSKFGNKVLSVTKLNGAAMKDLIDAAIDINNATFWTIKVGNIVQNASKVLEEVNNTNGNVKDSLDMIADKLPELTNLTDEALNHARNLRNRVSIYK